MPAEPVAFAVGEDPTLRGEKAGEGAPVVLCHGITATRRYVVHGSRALERAGHEVITYDARGHGESDPAPGGLGYGYPQLVADLEAVIGAEAGEGPLTVAGHSMGAHTAVAWALKEPRRLAGLVVIGPVFTGEIDENSVAYWDGLAAALEAEGVEGFVGYIDREQGIDPRWRDSVLRFTRERISRHRHPEAVAEAIREVARLAALRVPRAARASAGADPGGRQRRRRRPRAPPRRRRGVRAADTGRPPGQRGAGRLAARLAGWPALTRDRVFLRA